MAILWSVTSNLDKLAINESSPLFHFSLFVFSLAIIFSFIVLLKFRNKIKPEFTKHYKLYLLNGLFFVIAIWLQMLAISKILVSYVISIKRAHTFLTILWGAWFFKEHNIKERLIGALVMIAGVVLIVFFG